MQDKTEKILETTDLRTLWSDTLVGMLSDAIEYNWSSNAIREILKELYNKGYKPKQLVRMVEKKFGLDAAQKFKSQVSQGRTKTGE